MKKINKSITVATSNSNEVTVKLEEGIVTLDTASAYRVELNKDELVELIESLCDIHNELIGKAGATIENEKEEEQEDAEFVFSEDNLRKLVETANQLAEKFGLSIKVEISTPKEETAEEVETIEGE